MNQVADRELSRREAVAKTLDYISRQLGQLEIIEKLPSGFRPDKLMNRATDVLSTAFHYLDVHICREANRLGIIGKPYRMYIIFSYRYSGNIVEGIVKGDGDCESVEADLRGAVAEFSSTLTNFGFNVVFQHFEMGTRTLDVVEGNAPCQLFEYTHIFVGLREAVVHKERIQRFDTSFLDEKFIVPYQRNKHFTGRKSLLENLRVKLSERLVTRNGISPRSMTSLPS